MGMNSGGLFAGVNDSKVSARERHPGRGGAIHQGLSPGSRMVQPLGMCAAGAAEPAAHG